MEIKDFFSFRSKFVLSNAQVHAIELDTDEDEVSDHSKLIKGQYDGINFPVIFKHKYGKKWHGSNAGNTLLYCFETR